MPTNTNKPTPSKRFVPQKTLEIHDPELIGLRRVRGFSRYLVDKNGNVFTQNDNGTLSLKPTSLDKDGYPRVTLVHISDNLPTTERDTITVHRLMLLCWVGPCPDGHEADHIDRDRTNNSLENLRWIPVSENRKTAKPGRVFTRATAEEREVAVGLYRQGRGMAWIARHLGIGEGAVKRALGKAGVQIRASRVMAFVAGLVVWKVLPFVVAFGGGR